MFHFWSEDNKWLRNKKWSFIIKSSRVKYTRILDPQIPFWCQRSQRIFSFETFLCSGEIEFLREGENCFLFNFLRAETRPGPAFPQLQETEASEQPPPPAACAHYVSSWLATVRRFSSDCLSHLWSKSTCIIIRVFLLLLAWLWLVVCQHLTKHLQTFSHSLPRPSFPYVLLRLQYVSSPRKCPNGSILQHQQAGHKLFGANLSLCRSLPCLGSQTLALQDKQTEFSFSLYVHIYATRSIEQCAMSVRKNFVFID